MLTRTKRIRIVHTTVVKSISDGGGVSPYSAVDNYVNILQYEPNAKSKSVPVNVNSTHPEKTTDSRGGNKTSSSKDESPSQKTSVTNTRGDKSTSVDLNLIKESEYLTARRD